MYRHCISIVILLVSFSHLSFLKSISKDEQKDDAYNLTEYDTIYDQKQNGSLNVRVNVDGINVLWQPDSEFSYDLIDALIETAAIGVIGNIPWPSSTEAPEVLEDKMRLNTTQRE